MVLKCFDKSDYAKCQLIGKMRSDGWIALGFSNTNKTTDAKFVYGTMNNVIQNPLPPFYNLSLNINLYQDMGMLSIEIYMNYSMAIEMNYIIFAMRSSSFQSFNILDNTFLSIKNNQNVSQNCVILEPNILEGQSLPALIVMMAFFICLFFIWMFFRNNQVLKSRGFTVPINILSLYGIYIEQLIYFGVDLESRYYYSCYIQGILTFALYQTTFFNILMNFLRFLIMQYYNNKKEEQLMLRYNEETQNVHSLIYVLDYLTNPFLTLLLTISYTFIIILISILSNIPFDNQGLCTGYSYMIFQIIYSVLGFIIFICILIIQNLDLFYGLFSNRCNLYNFFLLSDPFHFRIELIHLPFLLIYYIIWEILVFLLNEDYYIVIMIFNSIYVYWIVIFQSILIIMITLFQIVYNRFKKIEENYSETISSILTSKRVRLWFIEYAKYEWNLENIMLWDEINKYKNQVSIDKRKKISEYIVRYFLAPRAIFDININKSESDRIIKLVDNGNFDDNLYSDILESIQTNLKETFKNFRNNDQRYIEYISNKQSK